MNKTKFASVLLAALVSTNAWALGAGTLRVNSEMGQLLDLTIDVVSSTEQELNSLRASLASRSRYSQSGVAYPQQGDNFRFELLDTQTGPKIHVLSSQPVTDNYLHLLLNLDWAGGSLMREYSSLIPTAANTSTTASTKKAEASTKPKKKAATARRSPSSVKVGNGQSLSEIANGLLPKGVTRHQAWLAFYLKNPSAFDNGNLNGLRRGATLNVPTKKEMLSTQPSAALRRINALSQPQGSSQQPITKNKPAKAKLAVVETKAVAATKKAMKKQAQTKAAKTTAKRVSPTSNAAHSALDLAPIQTDIKNLQKNLDGKFKSVESEIKAVKSIIKSQSQLLKRVESSNKRLSTNVASLTAVVNNTTVSASAPNTAAVTNSIKPAINTAAQGISTVTNAKADIKPTPKSTVQPATDVKKSNAQIKKEAAERLRAERAKLKQEVDNKVAKAALNKTVAEQPFGSVVSSSSPQAIVADSNRALNTTSFTGSLSQLFGGISEKVASVIAWSIAALLGLLFILLFGRKLPSFSGSSAGRDADHYDNYDSEPSFQVNDDAVGATSLFDLGKESAMHASSLESAFDTGGQTSLEVKQADDTGGYSQNAQLTQGIEVDPLAEAEVYLAYDRKTQAIQVLQDAHKNDPANADVAHKLLSVYKDNGDRVEYARVLSALSPNLKFSAEQREQIQSYGEDLIPEHTSIIDKAFISKPYERFEQKQDALDKRMNGVESNLDSMLTKPPGESKSVDMDSELAAFLGDEDQMSDRSSGTKQVKLAAGIATASAVLTGAAKKGVSVLKRPVHDSLPSQNTVLSDDDVSHLEDDIFGDVSSSTHELKLDDSSESLQRELSELEELVQETVMTRVSLANHESELSLLVDELNESQLVQLADDKELLFPNAIDLGEEQRLDELEEQLSAQIKFPIADLGSVTNSETNQHSELVMDDIPELKELVAARSKFEDSQLIITSTPNKRSNFAEQTTENTSSEHKDSILSPAITAIENNDQSLFDLDQLDPVSTLDTANFSLEADSRLNQDSLLIGSFDRGQDKPQISEVIELSKETGIVEKVKDVLFDKAEKKTQQKVVSSQSSTALFSVESSYDSGYDDTQHDPDTALALAKAYVELGEADIAKEFIADVMRSGDAATKAEAKKLLKSI